MKFSDGVLANRQRHDNRFPPAASDAFRPAGIDVKLLLQIATQNVPKWEGKRS